MAKKLNPKQLFVVSTMSREGIAYDLNGYLEGQGQEPELTTDDQRLTDDICNNYVKILGNAPEREDVGEEFYNEYLASACVKAIIAIGLDNFAMNAECRELFEQWLREWNDGVNDSPYSAT